jgi:HD-GYP domain-containing protein (c-di-GMP phosphodiesterase class II)
LSGGEADEEGCRWESDTRLRVGRSNSLEVVVKDDTVSREHAELLHTPRGWVLRDLGSSNGTYLNNAPLEGAERLVRAGDVLRLGRVNFKVVVACHAGAATFADRPATQIRANGACFDLKATMRRSWERAVEQIASHDDNRLWPVRRILPLLRAAHYLTQLTSLDELLPTLLREVVGALGAQRGAIVLADPNTGALRLRAVVTANDQDGAAKQFSETLAERCYGEGESLLCADVEAEEGLAGAQSVARGTMGSIICALLRSPRRRLGVLHLDRGPFQEPFTQEDFDLVDAVACYASLGIETTQMLEQQRDLFLRAATTLAQTVEMRDEYTGNHTQRVTTYALLLAEALGLSPAERQQIEIGAPLHDIGKIAVSDEVLRKPGRLSAVEQEQMKMHAARGAALLGNIPGLTPILPIVRHHHERWDGHGYPDGLAAEAIPLPARVVAVADAFDAMTSDRPYRPALPLGEALAELVACAGSHFDPRCVEAFLRIRPQIEAIFARRTSETPCPSADTTPAFDPARD